MIIFSCSPPDDECIRLAKEWIYQSGLNRDTISLVKNDRYVAVIHEGSGYNEAVHDDSKRNGGEGLAQQRWDGAD